MELPNTYDISILDSLFDTNGKQENFKNYKTILLLDKFLENETRK